MLTQNFSLLLDEDYDLAAIMDNPNSAVDRWLEAECKENGEDTGVDEMEMPAALLVYPGSMADKWWYYLMHVARYKRYLRDISMFNPVIHNFLDFLLSKLESNSPEEYAKALYIPYTDGRLNEKLLPWPTDNGAGYWEVDRCGLLFVLRKRSEGKFVIAQKYVTDSLQALMKADFMTGLNAGHKIHRCRVCRQYFLVWGGIHTLYCEGACPYAPEYTCCQFGNYEIQKELASDIPKLRSKARAVERISKDMRRGVTLQQRKRKELRHMWWISCTKPWRYQIYRRSSLSGRLHHKRSIRLAELFAKESPEDVHKKRKENE